MLYTCRASRETQMVLWFCTDNWGEPEQSPHIDEFAVNFPIIYISYVVPQIPCSSYLCLASLIVLT